jgi:uncharacterized protein (DUF342 family)
VTIRPDGLAAEAKVAAGPPMKAADLQAAIAEAKVVHGLDAAAIAQFAERIADPIFSGSVQIATGAAAVDGQPGRLEGEFQAAKVAGTKQGDGHIDFHERELLHPAVENQEVARIIAPIPGTPGHDVRGRVLPPRPGRPHTQRFGQGVKVDGERVIAARSGVIVCTDRLFDVLPLHLHKGDVDLASGNLHTPGSLLVQGDVHEGFAATADGDVRITGAVLDGKVSAKGSAQIDHGVMGAGCDVQAGADLHCRHATSARLQAGGSIEIGDQATHCRMFAGKILARRGRGTVFGGELHARDLIEVRVAGTPTGAATLLAVADLVDQQTELARLIAEAARLERIAARGPRGAPGTASDQHLANRAADAVLQERQRLAGLQRELLKKARIVVADTVHPGVVLQFGATVLRVTMPTPAASFHFDPETNTIVQGRPT